MTFWDILLVVLKPIGGMTGIAAVSYLVFRTKIVGYWLHSLISKLVLYITLPVLLVSKLTMATDLLGKYPGWYWLPVGAVMVMGGGGLIAWCISKITLEKAFLRKICFLMCFFINAGYFPLAIVRGVFSEYPDLEILVMISVIGVSPLLWSLSPYLLAGGRKAGVNYKKMINPPMVSVLIGIILMLLNARSFFESTVIGSYNLCDLVISPMLFIGDFTVPLILIVLGGTLSTLKVARPDEPRFMVVYVLTKLIVIPVIALLIIPLFGLNPLVAAVLLISSMQPSALALTVQSKEFAQKDAGDLVSEAMFYAYITSIITLTIFLTILKGMVAGWNIG